MQLYFPCEMYVSVNSYWIASNTAVIRDSLQKGMNNKTDKHRDQRLKEN